MPEATQPIFGFCAKSGKALALGALCAPNIGSAVLASRTSAIFTTALLPIRILLSLQARTAKSKVRFIGARNGNIGPAVIVVRIVRAHAFFPFAERAPIGHSARPWCGENLRIVDGEADLKPLVVIGVDGRAAHPHFHPPAVAFTLLGRHLRGSTVDQANAFDEVQRFAVGRSIIVDHGIAPELYADGVDDERVAFIMPDRVSCPRGFDSSRVLRVQPHASNLLIADIENRDLALLLHDLHLQRSPGIRRRPGCALVGGSREVHARAGDLAGVTDSGCSVRAQDRVRIIADAHVESAGLIHYRPWTAWRRFIVDGVASPEPGEIGDGGAVWSAARGQ